MSWSISINGPKEVVQREVADAILLLDRALDWVQEADMDRLSVNLNGYVSWDPSTGEIQASSVGFSVGESASPKPSPEPQATEAIAY